MKDWEDLDGEWDFLTTWTTCPRTRNQKIPQLKAACSLKVVCWVQSYRLVL